MWIDMQEPKLFVVLQGHVVINGLFIVFKVDRCTDVEPKEWLEMLGNIEISNKKDKNWKWIGKNCRREWEWKFGMQNNSQ